LQENIEQIKQKVDINLLEVSMYTSTEEEVKKAQDSGIPVGVYHKNKNNAAQKKQTKEKDKHTKMEIVKPTDSAPSESPSTTALPPGQQNKLDKVNKNENNNQQVDQNQDIQTSNPIPTEQGNGKQIPPGLNKDGTDKGNGNQANLGVNNKQEQPKTNNQNKPAKQEKNSKK
ncbi:MAG: hypothetical protein K0S80_4315, partial [Neobacillus sp.]|nr:hypothetical protein [Neobacillus sp.]